MTYKALRKVPDTSKCSKLNNYNYYYNYSINMNLEPVIYKMFCQWPNANENKIQSLHFDFNLHLKRNIIYMDKYRIFKYKYLESNSW